MTYNIYYQNNTPSFLQVCMCMWYDYAGNGLCGRFDSGMKEPRGIFLNGQKMTLSPVCKTEIAVLGITSMIFHRPIY